jgi:spore coat protein U-like protein
MKLKSIQLLYATVLTCCGCWAQAAITCTAPVSTGFSTAYASTGVVPNVTQGSVSFTCTRSAAGDTTNLLLRANNGVNVCAGSNDASFGGTCINYEAYQNSTCTTLWTGNNNATSIPVTLLNNTSPQPISVSFWGCITVAGQAPAAGAGTYTDTVTMTVRNTGGGTTYSTGTFPVSVRYPATCTISTAPGNVVLNYTSFGALVNASTTFKATCTGNLPYTMSLDAYSGTLLGLNYTLNINSQAPPVTSRGTGAAQTHTINGSIAAGQSGTCSTATCSASQTRTLTITY